LVDTANIGAVENTHPPVTGWYADAPQANRSARNGVVVQENPVRRTPHLIDRGGSHVKVWHIRKIGDDRYHIRCTHELDEEVNGSQFMGMLNAKHLNESQVEEIMSNLDAQNEGYSTVIMFTPEPVVTT
jgi:hypothetical protein